MTEEARERLHRTISKNLRRFREAKMPRTEAAKKLGVPYSTLQKWEIGKVRIPAVEAYAICVMLGVPVEELFWDEKHGRGDA